MQLILDIGSGKSLPDVETAIRVIDSVAAVDTHKHQIIFKTQLFNDIPPNVPLKHEVFEAAYLYAQRKGYKLTSSVFDPESLEYLLPNPVPFIKIAAPPEYRYLIGRIPREIPVYASNYFGDGCNIKTLACISKYPATIDEYCAIPWITYYAGISDHTVGWDLYTLMQPQILEKHFCFERNPDNPDAGPFACTPVELEELMR